MAEKIKEIKDYKTDTSQEVSELRKEIAELRRVVASQTSATASQAGNTISAAKHSIAAIAADAGSKARHILDNKKDQAANLADEGKTVIYKNPFESVGASFVAGALVSLLFFRR